MLHADANECKKKEEKKRTYLEWGHADTNALCADDIACGWHCVWMVLRADGVTCEWHCMQMHCMGKWMVVAAEWARMSVKRKQKTKYLLKPGWM